MLPETRRLQILDSLTRSAGQAVTVTALSRELGVSAMTIRRDLDWLAERAIVTRVHGGALLYTHTPRMKSHLREVEVKQAMLQSASLVILVADSSKYGAAQLAKIAPLTPSISLSPTTRCQTMPLPRSKPPEQR